MTSRHGVIFRILADLFVACFVILAFVAVSHTGNAAWLIGLLALYFLRRVWLATWNHPQKRYGFTRS